jgi:hypothetical protein
MKLRAILIGFGLIVLPAGVLASTNGDNDKEHLQKLERRVAADSAVTVSLCVMSGNIDVRGWDKNEVLVRSADAAQIELRRTDATSPSSQATMLEVVVVDKPDGQKFKGNCQVFSDVELKVPRGASVHLQTRDGNISIIEVASAYAGSQNGDINIERATRAVEVCTMGGTVSIKDSAGRVNVNSAGGNLDAINVRPSDPGDLFEAVTVSGDIELDRVSHTKVDARTVSGNVNLIGPLARGGRYGFKTMSGDVTLGLPADASFQLSAKVSNDGEIITDFPLTLTTEARSASPPRNYAQPIAPAPAQPPATGNPPNAPAPAQPAESGAPTVVIKSVPRIKVVTGLVGVAPYTLRRVNAIHGSGDATIYVASFSGTLHLQKN